MIKLIFKTILFSLPLLTVNLFIYNWGYLENEKKLFVLSNHINSNLSSPDKYSILCFGTSRFNTGISPSYLIAGIKNYIVKEPTCINLSFSAQQPGYLIQEKTKHIIHPVDLTLIELYPTTNPNKISIPLQKKPFDFLNEYLEYFFTKYSTMNVINQFFRNIIRNNIAIKYTYTHDDGWEERIYNKNKGNNGIERLKIEWRKGAKKDLSKCDHDSIYYNYNKFIKTIRDYQKRTNSRLCFIRMPVDGTLETIQDSILSKTKMIEIILDAFPNSIYIDSKNDTRLINFHTSEESHLSSEDAKSFSYRLGIILGQTISKK